MTKEKTTSTEADSPSSPNQTAEERTEILDRAAEGTATATGQEKVRLQGRAERPEGRERGSTVKIEGDIKPDFYQGPSSKSKPQGAQAKPANMAVNGTVEVNTVPSPSGPVPADVAGAGAVSAQLVNQAVEAESTTRLDPDKRVSEKVLASLDATTLRAVGADRGYNIPHGSARVVRARFREEEAARFGKEV